MKSYATLIGFVLLLIIAGSFPSCTKTDTITKIDTVKKTIIQKDSVFLKQQTLSLTSTKDASIFLEDGGSVVSNNGSGVSDLLRIGYNNEASCYVRTLVAFDVSALPAKAVIVSATLSFTLGKSGDRLGGASVYKLTQTWAEGTTDDNCYYYNTCSSAGSTITTGADVTWNSTSNGGTAWTTAGGTFVSTPSDSVANGGTPIFSSQGLINDVTAWRTTPSTNFGWLLKVNEAKVAKSGGEQMRYYGRDASTTKAGRSATWVNGADATTKPTLTIVYHL